MLAERNWLDFSSQFQGLLKKMKSAIGFPTAPESHWIDITYSVFTEEVFHLGQRNPDVLLQSWTPISSDLQPVRTIIQKGLRFQEDKDYIPETAKFRSRKEF